MTDDERAQLLELVGRLRDGGDPELIATALEALAQPPRRGRPPSAPAERAFRRIKRRTVADGLFNGNFPDHLIPEHLKLSASLAKGSRTEADAVAAKLIASSPSSIEKARAPQGPIETASQWAEFKAALGFVRRK